ncbi:hypothetical protein HRbin36_01657 [bacterium HR36]|uniref:DUF5666 domain-containing protein n=1 Tax=uncultured Planctomycetota bacterium TaxID=120965 RepID=H5SD01_9BACT|nr:hypothetical protein HGMM_F12C05C20 [uncultured Planctomycetota bacterium]GBD36532.1 hypothetical protein HRbin36_01657 [bacterium HR36]
MLRKVLATVVVLLFAVAVCLAAEGVVSSYNKDTQTAVIKVGDKEYTVKISDVKILSPKGTPIPADKFKGFKQGTKVEVTVDGGKVTEIKLLPAKKP